MTTAAGPQPIADRFSRGSIWRRWDLHFHTPSSYDYSDKSISNEALLKSLIDADIAAAVISDHHVIDADRIRTLRKLAGAGLTIFPGIELRTELGGAESVHLVGIFAEDADLDHIWPMLQGQLGLTAAQVKAKGDERVYVDFKEAATIIRGLGGLVSVHAGKKSNSIENISNTEAFKQAVKEDLARECIDILEIGRAQDAADYECKVFPEIKKIFPLIIGSDNHDAKKYALKIPTWIRSDPTFEGLRQILNEPHGRVFRGDLPPLLGRVSQNKTKYINEVSIRRARNAKFGEKWFECEVPFNPGLVAIIGNKGSGKSALSETIGLLGDTHNSASFSFLSQDKFRQPKNNKARYFRAALTWESGPGPERCLDSDVDPTAVETVKYIPQNFLETICNELRGSTEGRFDAELKSVIFSHVQPADRLGAASLDDLIAYKTQETDEAITLLRSELTEINAGIADLEEMRLPGYRKSLEAERAEKQRELDAHDATKPAPVVKPDLDPARQTEMIELTKVIEEMQNELAGLYKSRGELLEEQKDLTRRAALAAKLAAKIGNFEKQHQLFKDATPEFQELGIDAEQVVNVRVNTDPLTCVQGSIKTRADEVGRNLDASTAGGLAAKIAEQEPVLAKKKAELDAPHREYQEYLAALEQWKAKRAGIVGDADTIGSLEYIESRLKGLDNIPEKLLGARMQRELKAKEIFAKFESLAALYRTLYRPVQDFIERHPLAKTGFQLDFRVSIIDAGFEAGFFEMVSQAKKGSFCGIEEGRQALKALLDKSDWNSSESIFKFLEEIVDRLTHDYRQPKRPDVSIREQLKKEASVTALYDYLFSFGYLKPKYNLQWGGRDLEELSPGERGTVLLLFYLLVDSSTIPLVIDQPEENLDNQTVFNALVPAIKEARSRRQIIVVTHNPNLAVVCDADQVIYAHIDKKNGNKVMYEYGAIENPHINRRIIDVLEGTRPAFDNRDAKYQERPLKP